MKISNLLSRKSKSNGVAKSLNISDCFLRSEPDALFSQLTRQISETTNSIVLALVGWLWRQVASVEASVMIKREGSFEVIVNHPVYQIIWPVWQSYNYAIIDVLIREGNAYFLKQRSSSGRLTGLSYIAPGMIFIEQNQNGLISGYRVKTAMGSEFFPADEILHLRWLQDRHQPQLGISPLKSLSDLLIADNQSVQSTAALISNLGILGLIISPDDELGGQFDQEQIDLLRRQIQSEYSGRRRGLTAVFNRKVRIQTLTPDMSKFATDWITSLTEERICAVFGINPIVLYLGSGLDQSTYNNVQQAREEAWQGLVVPILESLSRQFESQILWEYSSDLRWAWDLMSTPAGVAQRRALIESYRDGFDRGVVTVSEYRSALGLDSEDSDRVYLRDPRKLEVIPGIAQWEVEDEIKQ